MPIQLLPLGQSVAILQNVVYALPARLCFITSSLALESSLDGIAWTTLTGATTGVVTGSVFIRCTAGNATVVCKDGSILVSGGSGGGGGGSSASVGDATRRQFRMQISDLNDITLVNGKTVFGLQTAVVGTGISTNINTLNRLFFVFATTATLNNTTGFANNGVFLTRSEFKPSVTFKIATDASIAVMRLWMTISNTLALDTDTPSTGNIKAIGFRYSTVAGDVNWQACCESGVGSTRTQVDTGIPVLANTFYTLKFEVVTTSQVIFSINGNVVATITTNIPLVTDMSPLMYLITKEAVIKKFLLSVMYGETD